MNEEQIKKMIADDFDNFINERLDSAIIFKYISNLEKENQKIKEDISFCLKSIKQEMEMSTDSRTKQEMLSCYQILKEWSDK